MICIVDHIMDIPDLIFIPETSYS